MRAAEHWKDFEVLDTSGGEKLERWGNVILARPDPQIIWNTPKGDSWKKINARYLRSRSGGGSWEVRNMPAGSWTIGYRELTFKIQPTGFKHTGLFPEQAVNWDFMAEKIRAARKKDPNREIKAVSYTHLDVYKRQGQNCKCTGCWKVYCDEREARRQFCRFEKCRSIYCRLYREGRALSRLTVAA